MEIMALIGQIASKLKQWDESRHSGEMDELDRYVAARAISAKANVDGRLGPPLEDIVKLAWKIGKEIDLSNIGYGPAHWEGGDRVVTSPNPYYFFLSGLARSQGFKRIFEIGTHFGGSIFALMRGISEAEKSEIVTVDITDLNPAIQAASGINKITGDANSEYIVKKVMTIFNGDPIDLMFIDADHRFLPTMTNFGLYVALLRPRMVVLDDIVLNDSMRTMWNVLRAVYGAEAINCVDVIPEIRSGACGFGLLRLR
jgi:hypothetical protein